MRFAKLIIVLLFSAFTAQAQWIDTWTFNPSAPACNDTVSVTLDGRLPASNYNLDSVKSSIVGSVIMIEIFTSSMGIGLPVITPFTRTVNLGPVSGGVYTVYPTIYRTNPTFSMTDQDTTSLTVGSCCAAEADITASDSIVCLGGMVTFTDTSTLGTAWWWKENGVTFSTNPLNATHTFNTAGYRTIRLVTGNGICMDSTEITIGVKVAPTANFNFVPNLNNYQFYDQSNAWNAEYLWDFGDTNSDTAKNPAHTYADTGMHVVCLTVTNSCGSDSSCQNVNVQCPLPQAGFSYTIDSLTITLTDTSSSNVDTYFWTFGDGAFSGTKNTSYTYASAGTYTVCLKTTNTCGVDSICETITAGNVAVEELNKYNLQVYPNPFNDNIVIEGLPSGQFAARYFTIEGKQGNARLQGNKINVNVVPGSYIFEILEDGMPVWRGKLIRE